MRSGRAAWTAWFIEPQPPAVEPGARTVWAPVVAVFGLARGCGATTIARGLAAVLTTRHPAGVAAVAGDGSGGGLLASRAATQLAATLADVPGASTRAVGRLALVDDAEPATLAQTARYHAPLVLDAGSDVVGGVCAAIADALVLVTTPKLEPALARVVAASLSRVGPEPILVVNHATDTVLARGVPEARIAARVAGVGREPPGALGRALRALADSCGFDPVSLARAASR